MIDRVRTIHVTTPRGAAAAAKKACAARQLREIGGRGFGEAACGERAPRSVGPAALYPDILANNAAGGKLFYTRELPYSFDMLIEVVMMRVHESSMRC